MTGLTRQVTTPTKNGPCTTTLKMKKKLSICESLLCLDLVSFLVLNGIKPQAPLLVVQVRQSLHVSGLRPCSHQKHKTLISQLDPSWFGLRLFPCVKGSYLRLDIKGQGLASSPANPYSHMPLPLAQTNKADHKSTEI